MLLRRGSQHRHGLWTKHERVNGAKKNRSARFDWFFHGSSMKRVGVRVPSVVEKRFADACLGSGRSESVRAYRRNRSARFGLLFMAGVLWATAVEMEEKEGGGGSRGGEERLPPTATGPREQITAAGALQCHVCCPHAAL